MLTCRNLLDRDCFYQSFDLCAGRKGIDNRILWFYIDNTPIRQKLCLHSGKSVGDLIFMNRTFIKRESTEQLAYLSQCVKHNMAGLVMVGMKAAELSQKFLKEAEDKAFPIFLMKQKESVTQVTKTIARMVIQEENKEEYTTVFMGEILSGKLDSVPLILSRGYECDIDLTCPYCFLSLKIDVGVEKDMNLSGRHYLEIMHHVLPRLEYLCAPIKTLKYFSFERGVCLFSIPQEEQLKKIRNIVDGYLKQYYQENHVLIKAGYSNIYQEPEKLEAAYEESQAAMQAAMKASAGVMGIGYDELSILRFVTFLSKEERRDTIEAAKKRLAPLLEYDKNNKSDLLNTFYEYLRSDGNLIEASQNLYIHRNTLLKRLKRIEELLRRDIRDFQVKWDAYNSIYILKYFDVI